MWCELPGRWLGNAAITDYGCRIFQGLRITLELVGISVSLGLVLGVLLALARLSPVRPLAAAARGYMAFFRGTPLICQLFLVYYGAGQFRPFLDSIGLWGLFREAFFCAAFTFTLNTSAYQAEVFRGAILSVPRGQWEAGEALGLHRVPLFLKVILPQALMVALRPLGNELVIMVKSSAVASLVTLYDLMGATRLAFARSFDLSVYFFAAALYLLIVETIRRVWGVAERRLTRHLTHA